MGISKGWCADCLDQLRSCRCLRKKDGSMAGVDLFHILLPAVAGTEESDVGFW